MNQTTRVFGELTQEEVCERIAEDSVLCIPVGSLEQHGPHLPLNTDTVLATRFALRMVAELGQEFDLWLLPPLEYGLSREHGWACGTVSLSIELFVGLLHEVVDGLINCQPARNIIIINGHGGNRGVCEALIQEFRHKYRIAAIVLHPSSLSHVKSESGCAEVHGGKSETSAMLALAPDLVRLDRLPPQVGAKDQERANSRILERGVSWPWHSNDPGLGRGGVIGDAASASKELGERIVVSALHNAKTAIQDLIEFGRFIRKNVSHP